MNTPIKTKVTFPGLRKLLLPRRPNSDSTDAATMRARALFLAPESAMTTRRRSLVEFLGRVSLFEDLGRRDLVPSRPRCP